MGAPAAGAGLEPYAALLAFAERERALIAEGRFDELAALGDARERLIAGLPATPPAHARPLADRAAAVQAEVTASLTAARDALAGELRKLHHGRAATRGYGGGAATPTLVDFAG